MATMKTLNGYGFNATELNGKTSDNYLLITDTASDSAKLGGKAPEYYIQPRNLLDNSDFLHPVNQRNKTSVSNNGYFIDRWVIYSKNEADRVTSIDSNGLTTAGGSAVRQLVQAELVPKNAGEYTFAVCRSDGYIDFPGTWKDSNGNLVCPISNAGTYIWAALYEGSYTADTLPPYVSKGKHAEMLNCGVSLTPHNLLDNSDFRNPVNQRGITTTDSSFTGYMLDRWIVQNSGTLVTLDSNGLNVAASSGAKYLFQRLNNVKNGKTYTFAAALSDGTIGVCAFTLSSTTSTWEWIKEVHVSSSFQISVAHSDWMPLFVAMSNLTDTSARIIWAALYEGSYTSDTLPPYVSKGYAAELAECRRYFRRYTAKDASLILSGLVTSGAKDISVHAPELTPMRAKDVSIAYSGSGVIIRGVSGYATECSNSSIYGNISVSPYQNNSSFCATIDINKKDGTAWGLTNNTPVVVNFAANGTLDYIADL